MRSALGLGGRFAGDGGAVFEDGVADAVGEGVLIGFRVDEAGFVGVAHESAFHEDGGVADAAEDAEARAFDAAVEGVGAEFLEEAAVDGGGEGDVCGVVLVSCAGEGVTGDEAAAVVGDAGRGEGEGFDAAGGAAAGVEVDADEDGFFGDFVGEVDALLEGEVLVGGAGHDDAEAALFEEAFDAAGEFEVVVGFGAVGVGCAGVFAAVAGIEDDGSEVSCFGDEVGAEDGVDEFGEVHA